MNVSPHLVSMGCAVIYLGISSVSVRKDGQVDTVIKVKPLFTAGKKFKQFKIIVWTSLFKKMNETNYNTCSLIFSCRRG